MRTRARERKRERERSKRKSARPHDDDTDENNASLAFICEPRARARREQQNGRERCGYKVVRICFDMTDKVSGVKLFFFSESECCCLCAGLVFLCVSLSNFM